MIGLSKLKTFQESFVCSFMNRANDLASFAHHYLLERLSNINFQLWDVRFVWRDNSRSGVRSQSDGTGSFYRINTYLLCKFYCWISKSVDCEPLNKSKNILSIVVVHGTSHPK